MRARECCRGTPVQQSDRGDPFGLRWLVLARDSPWPLQHCGPMLRRAAHNDLCLAVNDDTLQVFCLIVNVSTV